MTFAYLDIDDDCAVSEWFGPIHASEQLDWPDEPGWLVHELRALIRDRTTSTSVLAVVRGSTGSVLGSLWVRMPKRENRHVAHLSLAVEPEHRGLGIGRALLAVAEEVSKDCGRSKVVGGTDEPVHRAEGSRNAAFARSAGYSDALAEARRALQLPVDPERLDALEAACSSFGAAYQILTWTGSCPSELVNGRVALARSISTDAPQGTLDSEEADWDVERLRNYERTVEDMDRDTHSAGAIALSSGELVGFTEVDVPRTAPEQAYQIDTIVLPEHRGHRLGTLLKIANLRALAERSPATGRVLTWNAVANEPMTRVNEVLGFELVGAGTVWQKQLA
jgi:GNAT superfamily N-acetyltransferase